MPVRGTEPDPRIDAVRGCVALERGPLVYCIEAADVPEGVELEEIELDPLARPALVPRPDVAEGLVGLRVPALRRPHEPRRWPYGTFPSTDAVPLEVGAVPYYAWANRTAEAMRVWIPGRDQTGETDGGR
jgi:DUF1680 family protein